MSLESFLSHFYKEYNEITADLSNLTKVDETSGNVVEKKQKMSSSYELISNRTITLQKYLTENTKFIPVFETRKAQEHLTKLSRFSQGKREEIFPKKKFGFKSKEKMTTLADAINTANETDELNNQSKKNHKDDQEEMFYKDSSCTIKDIDGKTVVKYGEEINGQDIAILNIKNACIQLYGNPSVLHAKNIEDSIILCGPISGSAFMNNLKNVKLIIACHQLRIHESYDCDFYVHLGSRAIIENCSNVKFAQYSWSYSGLSEDFNKSSLNFEQSNWKCIDDFNWLNQNKESPNWSFLDESKRLKWTTKENGELTSE